MCLAARTATTPTTSASMPTAPCMERLAAGHGQPRTHGLADLRKAGQSQLWRHGWQTWDCTRAHRNTGSWRRHTPWRSARPFGGLWPPWGRRRNCSCATSEASDSVKTLSQRVMPRVSVLTGASRVEPVVEHLCAKTKSILRKMRHFSENRIHFH